MESEYGILGQGMSAKVGQVGNVRGAMFVGGSYSHRSTSVDAEKTLNKYPEYMESDGARVPSALIDTPGLHEVSAKTGLGGIRCAHTTASGRLFVVFESSVFEFAADFSRAFLFRLDSDGGRVTMVDNGEQLFLADGWSSQGWIYDLTANTAALITDINYPGGYFACFLDGYFLTEMPGSQKFYWSQLNDGMVWPALNFASAEGFPDAIVSMVCTNLEIWLLGSKSTEVWYHSTDPIYTFQRFPSAVIPIGCAAPWSVAEISGVIFWIGAAANGYGSIWMSQGHGLPKRVSNYGTEYQISRDNLADAVAYCYAQEGHTFYVLSLPSANKTLCFDVTTGQWHDRGYMVPETGVVQRHLGHCLTFAFGKNIIGDFRNDALYWYDMDWYRDGAADRIKRMRRFPTYHADRAIVSYWSLEIFQDTGNAPLVGDGSAPQMMLRISNDGGRTWPGELWRSMGKQGEYTKRVRWGSHLGQARERVFEVTSTEPIKQPWLGAYIEAEAVTP